MKILWVKNFVCYYPISSNFLPCWCVCVFVLQVASQNYVAEAYNVLGEW